MPRYFFHIYNSIEVVDEEGTLLPSLEAAKTMAIKNARALIASEIIDTGQLYLGHWLEIADEDGNATPIRFGDCVEVNP